MRKRWILCCLLAAWTPVVAAQKGVSSLLVSGEEDAEGKAVVILCFQPEDRFDPAQCGEELSYKGRGKEKNNQLLVPVKQICGDLAQRAKSVNTSGWWNVTFQWQLGRVMSVIDCQKEQAWPTSSASPSDPKPSTQLTPLPPATASGAVPSGKNRPAEDKLRERVDKLEKDLAEQKRRLEEELKGRGVSEREVEERLKPVLDKLRTLEEAQKNSCIRVEDRYQDKEEVIVAVAGGVLRFLRVQPKEPQVAIGLTEAQADEFLATAQAGSSRTIFPHIYLAVPEVLREVEPFWLQDRLIDPGLYQKLTKGKDANKVAFDEVQEFIDDLNKRCDGLARFELPSEEQLVAAAHLLYDPAVHGLVDCKVVRRWDRERHADFTELLGQSWQLTRSPCRPFGNPPKATCPDDSYVRKGGAASSDNPLECLPEYRSLAPADVQQKETSFRLVLAQ